LYRKLSKLLRTAQSTIVEVNNDGGSSLRQSHVMMGGEEDES